MSTSPFAILQLQGHQYRVEPGTVLTVDRLDTATATPGSTVTFTDVLFACDAAGIVHIGAPTLPGSSVKAEVIEHLRGEKLRIFKMKPKKRYRRTQGHRSELTTVRVTELAF